ncbi:hypothetical protein FRB97_009577 [Tulasnella sp. 331]|nr:hypothetical protein FRB97_009577 [Tulasnella sp. 331]KAG8872944.1 hypothetical protein FRB98_009284 [Tulasnella sp. 332]
MARISIIALSAFLSLAGLIEAAAIPDLSIINPITSISALATTSTTSVPALPSGVFCDVIMNSPPILAITNGTAVKGLELYSTNAGSAVLSAAGYHQGWSFSNGGVGVFDGCHYLWLNIGESTTSYKPLSFAFDDQLSTNWIGGSTSPLTAGTTAGYLATSTFLACQSAVAGQWALYLQTGPDVPGGQVCTDTQLELGPSTLISIA